MKTVMWFLISSLFVLTSVASPKYSELFLKTSDFDTLGETQKSLYLHSLKENFLAFEKDLNQGREISDIAKQFRNWFSFSETAYAAQEGFCIVGGVKVPVLAGKCSTRGNYCTEVSDGFQCGKMFSSLCISRTPLSTLSSRCAEAPAQPVNYPLQKKEMEALYKDVCVDNKVVNKEGCRQFQSKMNSINTFAKAEAVKEETIVTSNSDSKKKWAGTMKAPTADKCAVRVSAFKETMSKHLADEKGQKTFSAASNEIKAVWEEILKLRKKCASPIPICSEVNASTVITDELDPAKFGSSTWNANALIQDIHALGATLNYAQTTPKDQRKKSDLDKLIRELRWPSDSKAAVALQEAYLADESFSNNSGNKSLVNLALKLGAGRSQRTDENFITWTKSGAKDLDDEAARIKKIYLSGTAPTSLVLTDGLAASKKVKDTKVTGLVRSELEVTTAQKLVELLTQAKQINLRLAESMDNVKHDLSEMTVMPKECIEASDIADYLTKFKSTAPAAPVRAQPAGSIAR